ncbi:ATP-dependent RNA helicase DDX42 [Parasteatoda tepidariorum]|uniref:ATP-dependent RNA helicase DDX42 n=1 Tax=Parasteatoda tepidariorum TaxID=114398 RepID=A0A2L2Y9Z8_PARTP|nr:ATP-dependent RNA helicase DDX42 [Parasteatoda tepidariorum]XP_015922774.1 ATP-dependent RNA helicase DDX42 [Parasteatoda tepidariorum]
MFHKGGDGKPRGFGFGGFSLGGKKQDQPVHSLSAMPPPPMVNKHGYTGLQAITQTALDATYGIPRKRPKTEEEYFEQEDDEEPSSSSNSNALAYIPAPGSPSWDLQNSKNNSDSEEDPLDAFMAGLDNQVAIEKEHAEKMKKKEAKGIREDIENEDDEESYYRYIEENPLAGLEKEDSEGELEYDEDGNPIAPAKSKYIDPLPKIDHSEIQYESYEKNFYEEHEEIAKLLPNEVEELRNKMGIKVTGPAPPKLVASFAHFGFDESLIKAIRKSEYTQPTPIQAQGIPAALAGRDVIGIAKTGSGKTAAFLWPMLVHIMDQKELEPGDGPIGLILAPTRELSQQIYTEAKRFGKVYGINVVCCFGGGSKWEQTKALQEGAEIVVATPGRMIDHIKAKSTNLKRVTFLVLDEADRMFDMGFEPQVRSICDHVRPDRQTLMFSATFKKKIERLARDVLTDPVRIVQGELGEANEDVTQIVLVMPAGPAKWVWLTSKLVELLSSGSVLIFVTKKANAEELSNNLKLKEYDVALLHGDIDQNERSKVILSFKKKEVPILVATDVAARGLDITHVKTVVNYDIARDIDTHTHRIGRTGRAGEKGIAYTLVTDKDKEFAGHLVRNLEGANQAVPQALMDLAMQSSWFRKSRFKQGKGKKMNYMGGQRERPGLGSEEMYSGGAAKSSIVSSMSHSSLPKFSGPQTDRLSAMKSAFQSQYKTQFTAATDTAWKMASREKEAEKERIRKERKKSRWDNS